MNTFYIKLAGLTVKISAIFDTSRELCRDYIIEPIENPNISISMSEDAISKEQINSGEPVSPQYQEFLCIYRSIAEELPKFGAFVFHGAAISYEDKGYLFTAPSGTGKSTHIMLWRKHIGADVDIINGDKPVIKITNDGIFVCSTPWAGKECWQKNRILPLAAVTFLERSKSPSIIKENPKTFLSRIMNQIYMPKNTQSMGYTLELIDKLLSSLPLYTLGCDISENSVKVAFEELTGKKYNFKGAV